MTTSPKLSHRKQENNKKEPPWNIFLKEKKVDKQAQAHKVEILIRFIWSKYNSMLVKTYFRRQQIF